MSGGASVLKRYMAAVAALLILAAVSFSALSVDADNTYTITFNANGGSKAPGKIIRVSARDFAGYRFAYRYPVRKGYVFYTWNTRKDGKGRAYKGGSLIKMTKKNTTLYAIWKKGNRFSISYSPSGGSDWPAETVAVSSTRSFKLTISDKKPVRSGFKFLSWNTKASGNGTSYKPGQTVILKQPQELKLYARWQRVYTYELTFNANGGTGAPSKITKVSPNKSWGFELPSKTPTRSGYKFVSWNTMQNGKGSTYRPGGRLVRRMGSPKATLYAVWKRVSNNGVYLDPTAMYAMLNEYRTSDELNYLSENGVTYYYNNNKTNRLFRMFRDRELEKAARIRAEEIATDLSHNRPNGRDLKSLVTYAKDECIAAASNAESAFEGWKALGSDYAGQVNRRKLIDHHYNGVGIAGYQVNGREYWVILFGIKEYRVTDSYEKRVGNALSGARLFINGEDVTDKTVTLGRNESIEVSVLTVPQKCAFDVHYYTNTYVNYYNGFTGELISTSQLFPPVDYTETYEAFIKHHTVTPISKWGMSGSYNGKAYTTQKDTEVIMTWWRAGSAPIIANIVDEFGNEVTVMCRVDLGEY